MGTTGVTLCDLPLALFCDFPPLDKLFQGAAPLVRKLTISKIILVRSQHDVYLTLRFQNVFCTVGGQGWGGLSTCRRVHPSPLNPGGDPHLSQPVDERQV